MPAVDAARAPGPTVAATATLTVLALLAFAANSILCRLALGTHAIDAASFALVRLGAGAVLLGLLRIGRSRPAPPERDHLQPFLLFAYAAAFAFAYTRLTAGTGALVLFGCVQATMLGAALRAGEIPSPAELAGLVAALAGLGWLVAPGLAAPSLAGSALMATAGIAWGVYTLRGRANTDAVLATARNFASATPLAMLVAFASFKVLHASPRGLLLAAASGAITSGLGYVAWFAALRGLGAISAAAVQLAVPALTAAGGVLLLGEHMTLRLALATALILGGVALAMAGRARRSHPRG